MVEEGLLEEMAAQGINIDSLWCPPFVDAQRRQIYGGEGAIRRIHSKTICNPDALREREHPDFHLGA